MDQLPTYYVGTTAEVTFNFEPGDGVRAVVALFVNESDPSLLGGVGRSHRAQGDPR